MRYLRHIFSAEKIPISSQSLSPQQYSLPLPDHWLRFPSQPKRCPGPTSQTAASGRRSEQFCGQWMHPRYLQDHIKSLPCLFTFASHQLLQARADSFLLSLTTYAIVFRNISEYTAWTPNRDTFLEVLKYKGQLYQAINSELSNIHSASADSAHLTHVSIALVAAVDQLTGGSHASGLHYTLLRERLKAQAYNQGIAAFMQASDRSNGLMLEVKTDIRKLF